MDIVKHRLRLQRNYEPKLRALVEIRTRQLGFNELERNRALRSIDALSWKLTVAGIHLERLWENKESFDLNQLISKAYGGEQDPRRFTDEEITYLTLEFEAYLIQARALITVAQIHTLDACRQPFGGRLTNEKFEKAVKGASDDVKERLFRAHEYFVESVFGPGKWGSVLKSLRDRVLHLDRVRPLKISGEDGSEELIVRGLSLERLTQDYENGTYELLVNVIAPIWERDWSAGVYTPGMWEH
jgi:hypothetical protein